MGPVGQPSAYAAVIGYDVLKVVTDKPAGEANKHPGSKPDARVRDWGYKGANVGQVDWFAEK